MPEANEMVVGIMTVVAQAERKMISAKTKAALAAAEQEASSLAGLSAAPGLPRNAQDRRRERSPWRPWRGSLLRRSSSASKLTARYRSMSCRVASLPKACRQ
jgi:DNA invertase Pin-like site-specific DNA recombinase